MFAAMLPDVLPDVFADVLPAVRHHLLTAVLALPSPVKRRLAGAPVTRDGLRLDVDTQVVLKLQRILREDGIEDLPIGQGRRRVDAQSRTMAGRPPIGAVFDRLLGDVPGRIFVPRSLRDSTTPRPTLVFLHGGGFIYGGLDSHDGVCRVLAERSGVQVIAVAYRLAPEHPFPAAYDDSVAAYAWIVEHAHELRVDTARLAVGGDSAGANLAIGVSLHARAADLPLSWQLLVYPVTDMVNRAASRETFREGFFLTKGFMDLAVESYLPRRSDRKDPRASPLLCELPAGLAPALVVTAGFDPLRDEGEAFARHLAETGAVVTVRREDGLVHSFLNWVGVGRAARSAVRSIADEVGAALS